MWVGLPQTSYSRSSYTGPRDDFQEASGFDFECSPNIQLRLEIFFLYFTPIFSPKANMNYAF